MTNEQGQHEDAEILRGAFMQLTHHVRVAKMLGLVVSAGADTGHVPPKDAEALRQHLSDLDAWVQGHAEVIARTIASTVPQQQAADVPVMH